MATTTILLQTNLEVVSKQRELVTEALGADGAYIRTKETLEELFNDGEFTGVDRASLIANTLSQLATSITNSAMSTALQWAYKEKDLYLKKEELELQFEAIKLNNKKAEQDVIASIANKHLLQAKVLREYGKPTLDADGNVVVLADEGRVFEEIRALRQDTSNKALVPNQMKAQTDEVNARTHKLIADTYVNHGLFTGYTITPHGIAYANKVDTGYVTLSDMNKQVAKEQAKGYAWNAWSNAASSSSGMIGTLIASETAELVDDAQEALTNWSSSITKLNAIVEPNITI